MAKLPSLFPELILTQGLHGEEQDFQAFDLSNNYRELIAPIDGVKLRSRSGIGTQKETFNLELPDADKTIIQCVHCKPVQKVGYIFKKGEKIGELVPYINSKGQRADHWHIAIKYKNKWHPLPSIIDQKTRIITRTDVNPKLSNFDSYSNIELNLPNTKPIPPKTIYMTEQQTQEIKDLLTNNIGIAEPQPIIEAIEAKNYSPAFARLIFGNRAKARQIAQMEIKAGEMSRELIARNSKIKELEAQNT